MGRVEYTYEDNLISDLHKDARGHRPSYGFMLMWDDLSPAQKQEKWDSLCEEMEESIEMEKQMEKVSLDEFRKTLRATMKTTGTNWKRALFFLAQAEDINIEDNSQEFSHFLWRQGIGYEDRNKICKLYEETV
jgi:hypothetical protein|tara:strand:+ start:127 stop:525 length:399 start_codon:yes stop_codon:yes gene_type:complete